MGSDEVGFVRCSNGKVVKKEHKKTIDTTCLIIFTGNLIIDGTGVDLVDLNCSGCVKKRNE